MAVPTAGDASGMAVPPTATAEAASSSRRLHVPEPSSGEREAHIVTGAHVCQSALVDDGTCQAAATCKFSMSAERSVAIAGRRAIK